METKFEPNDPFLLCDPSYSGNAQVNIESSENSDPPAEKNTRKNTTRKTVFSNVVASQNINCFFVFKSAAHHSVKSDFAIDDQPHPDYQIVLTVRGRASAFYEDESFNLSPGTALLVNRLKNHRFDVPENEIWEFKVITFTTDYPELLLNSVPTYIPNFLTADRYFDNMVAFSETPESKSAIAPFIYSNYISCILTGLVQADYKFPLDRNQKQLLEVIQYINEHFDQPIFLKEIAKKFNYSESYFIRLFKKYYGNTPYQHLIHYRLAKVEQMLQEGATVQKAALSCGFNSTSSYYHALKMRNCAK